MELKARTREVEADAPEQLPVGLGKLTSEILEREVALNEFGANNLERNGARVDPWVFEDPF